MRRSNAIRSHREIRLFVLPKDGLVTHNEEGCTGMVGAGVVEGLGLIREECVTARRGDCKGVVQRQGQSLQHHARRVQHQVQP